MTALFCVRLLFCCVLCEKHDGFQAFLLIHNTEITKGNCHRIVMKRIKEENHKCNINGRKKKIQIQLKASYPLINLKGIPLFK